MYPIPTGTPALLKSPSRATLTQSDSVIPFSHCHMVTPLSTAKSQRSYRRLQNDDLKKKPTKERSQRRQFAKHSTIYSEAQTRFLPGSCCVVGGPAFLGQLLDYRPGLEDYRSNSIAPRFTRVAQRQPKKIEKTTTKNHKKIGKRKQGMRTDRE